MTGTSGDGADETLGFMRQFQQLLRRMGECLPDDAPSGEPLEPVLTSHLGEPAATLAVVTENVPPHRVVDADIALAQIAGEDPAARIVGLSGDMRHHMQLGDILGHGRRGPVRLGQVDYLQMDTGPGPDDRRQVVSSGVHLFHVDGRPVVVRVQGRNPQYGREQATMEVIAPERDVSEALIGRLRELMDTHSVIRGQVVTLAGDPYGHGMSGLTYVQRPTIDGNAVILPDGLLDRVARHVVGMGAHRERLLAHGQHLKRGVLLYGPPGTGKTHTVRYLLSATPGTTAVLLSGGSLQYIHDAAKIARAHQPALVVLEDCDLIAEDRSMGMGSSPLLFEVLDALDGLDADADVVFLLTTNRVEDLEVALAQRPGRVDLAAEIPLPDSAGRLALLRLYGGHLFGPEALSAAAARSEGTTASFTKELVRRAVLTAAVADEPPSDEHLGVALDELMSDTERLTRSLLGVGADELAGGPDGPGGFGGPGGPGFGGPGMMGPGMMVRGRPMRSRASFAYDPTVPH
ncbi:MAG: Cell division protein FtsH [Humibacillus sp.]|nr:Cell division protein FtsH [Humibacillus sp.]